MKTKLFVSSFVLLTTFVLLAKGTGETNANFYSKDERSYSVQAGDLKVLVLDKDPVESKLTIDKEQARVIQVRNKAEVSQFVRLMIHPTLIDSKGISHVVALNEIAVGLNLIDWIDGKDGYYYYNKKLKEGQTTAALVEKIKVQNNTQGKLTLGIKAEAVTAEDQTYVNAWWQSQIPESEPLKSVYEVLYGEKE
ncbi:hypothetical protein ATZ33_08750 [Enterococcus silesiacus]|uniref:Uncharacterized protein n=1 Tax=Enterococcus silesiacus TaxID=332949 RepID=A0A0S3KAX2_9ENTE|nr:hypothetical protein [Enterococcus silesiacus]ALS01451.1 hypothetical protein ATZ33_08750 [Enterococcus silesiacus]OJG87751.1 hypothetical protein RV15_GL001884 [Enterococcus silesiacus]